MSLTETETVFASVHETALNDLLRAFFTARPHYLNYGSPSFVPATTVAETSMAAIAFPGVPGGIQWRIRLTIPDVDLFKQSSPLPPELALGPGQLSVHIGVDLCLDCRRIKIDPQPPPKKGEGKGTDKGKETGKGAPATGPGSDRKNDDRKNDDPKKDDRHPISELTCC